MEQGKGSLKIEINEGGLNATLVLTADPEGEVWSLPKVQNVLEEKGIIEGVSKTAVQEALKAFAEAEAGTSVRKEIARGTEPEPATSEYYEWKELPLPESLKTQADRLFREYAFPDIKIKRTEKVKVRKKVLKKSKLLFVAPKEQIVEEWQKKIVEEPAPINPKVAATGYVEQGDYLAELRAGEPGRDGRSVLGKPLSPDPAKPVLFYPGKGVKVDRNGLLAEKSGFFRRGSNWVEVFDFLSHSWELSLSKDKATLLFAFTPGHREASIPEPSLIIAKAGEEFGFSVEQLKGPDKLREVMTRSVQTGKALERIPLTRDRDAFFSVEVSSDNLKGLLTVVKGSGRGKPLILREVGAAIKASGFSGLDFGKIQNDLLEFYHGNGIELRDYLLAEGAAPSRGEDRSFDFSVDFLPETEYEALKVGESGFPSEEAYPMGQARSLARVAEGTVVGVLSSAQEGSPGKDVYGKVIPGIPGIDPHIELLENVRMEKDRFIAETTGLLEVFDGADGIVLRVRPYRDAEVKIELSTDKMEAWLTIEPPSGSGTKANRSEIDQALKEAGIVKGIIEEAITDALEISGAGSPVRRSVVARGKRPDDAGGSRIALIADRPSGKGVTITRSGRADYRNQDRFVSVKEGDLLAEILPNDQPAEDGWDLTGKPISAKDAPALDIEIGENIRQEEEGNRIKLYAACSGEFVYEKKKLDILKVHTVSGDVDFSSGNVKFSGTVAVSGSVRSGFSILAEGHVKVAGNAEASLISSGESITIAQGIVGGGKAVIRAKSSIETIFAEQATLLAVGSVSMKNACLRCMVKCNGRLRLVGEKGNLIGGVVRAREGVIAANIGNPKGSRTEISFGQDYLVMDRIELEEREVKKLRNALARIDTTMAGLEKQGDKGRLEMARKEKLKMMKMLEKRSMLLFTLRERFEQHYDSSVVVRGTVYPGVVIESHGRYWSTETPKKGITLIFDQETGRIIEASEAEPKEGEKSA